MEHAAYREISTECSQMNAPLYRCYDEKGRLYGVVFFLLFYHPSHCSKVFPGNKESVRLLDHSEKACSAVLTDRKSF